MSKQYEIRYEQVADKDDPRGYHWEERGKIEVIYNSKTKEYKRKKGAKWQKTGE